MSVLDVLQTVAWCERHFGSACTSRGLPRREVKRCEAAGMVRHIGTCELVDADGSLTGRHAEGYQLTELGNRIVNLAGTAGPLW